MLSLPSWNQVPGQPPMERTDTRQRGPGISPKQSSIHYSQTAKSLEQEIDPEAGGWDFHVKAKVRAPALRQGQDGVIGSRMCRAERNSDDPKQPTQELEWTKNKGHGVNWFTFNKI